MDYRLRLFLPGWCRQHGWRLHTSHHNCDCWRSTLLDTFFTFYFDVRWNFSSVRHISWFSFALNVNCFAYCAIEDLFIFCCGWAVVLFHIEFWKTWKCFVLSYFLFPWPHALDFGLDAILKQWGLFKKYIWVMFQIEGVNVYFRNIVAYRKGGKWFSLN